MIYGYARVSTRGQSLDEQIDKLITIGVNEHNIYSEKYTGTRTERPEFNRLLDVLENGDTLVITKLDRLARNTREALGVIENLMSREIAIQVLNLGTIENTSIGRLIYTTLLAVAELERDMIVERTQEGKAYAKKNNPNFKEGRPKRKLTPKYLHAIEVLKENSFTETERKTGISRSTLQRIKKQYIEETGDEF